MKYHTLFFRKLGKMSKIMSSAAAVIGALSVNTILIAISVVIHYINASY